jgi:hypothetical protein
MAVFFGAGVPFIEEPAAPDEIYTSFRVAFFLGEYVIGGNRSSETLMRGMVAGKDVVPFILISKHFSHFSSL